MDNMNRKTMLVTAVSLITIIILIIGTHVFIQPKGTPKLSWLKSGDYVTYEQDFVLAAYIRKTEFMTWNITKLHDDLADLHLVSYNATVNPSNKGITISVNEANWTLNVLNREITNSPDSSYIGYKCPFWIESSVGIGSTIDSLYGQTAITRNETINVLGLQRACWVTEQNSPASNMTRWYDKPTGIVLMIHIVLHQSDVTIEITETAMQTNVVFTL
jgi:hypothetical protein